MNLTVGACVSEEVQKLVDLNPILAWFYDVLSFMI